MPRSKTGNKREAVDAANPQLAVNNVLQNNTSLRAAAALYKISKSTLARHNKLHRESSKSDFEYSATNDVRKIFTVEEEKQLEEYLQFSSRLHYGLNKQEIRELAYHYANKNNKKCRINGRRRKKQAEISFGGFRNDIINYH
ncbi:hypothetical protein JTB14_034946 [Gonioctena quinquepunctata]|nr:hypothetical protein JTB14_034946 [Gonioctena quinquepunctata]